MEFFAIKISIMTIQEKIKGIREAKGITQAFVADLIDMDRASYSKMEKGSGDRIYHETIVKICKALGISIYELLEYGEPGGSAISAMAKELEQLRREKMELLEEGKATSKKLEDVSFNLLITNVAMSFLVSHTPALKEAYKGIDIRKEIMKDANTQIVMQSMPNKSSEEVAAIINKIFDLMDSIFKK
jgi:transcriptional regulator with XRE-family HTH domain